MTEAITVPFAQAMLLDLITTEQLEAMREGNKENPEVVNAINAHLEAKAQTLAIEQAIEGLMTGLNSLELPSVIPPSINNIFRPRINETRKLTKAEVKEVLSSNPSMNEDEVSTRLIETGNVVWGAWVLNKALSLPKGSTTAKTSTRKLAITLNSRQDNMITPIGNFRTSKEACNHLGLDTKGDSARRVLEANHYIIDDYDGNQYLISEA